MRYKKTILKNGVRLITVPQRNTQTVTVLVLVKTGSKYEKKEISGISHFLEHMMFKGTKKRPSPIAVAETLDRIGGIYNAFTGEDYTGYFAKVEASHFNLALDWVADIFLNSLLPEKEIRKEKGVIIEEINMHYDHPMSYVGILWNKLLYGDQPAGWNIAGTKETVMNINRKKLFDYRRKQYVAENTIISVAGRIKNSDIARKVEKYFSKVKQTEPLKKPKVIEKQSKPQCLLYQKKTDQVHLHLGVRAYNMFHPKKYALEVLATILGGMMSSRIFTEVREKLGIAYYIKTEAEENPDTGFLVTQAGVDNRKIEKAISVILREYKKISQKKVSLKEIKKAKDYIKGKMALVLESSDAKASFYGTQELLEKKIFTQKEICEKINKVRSSDVLNVALDIFRPKNLNLALIGPFEKKEYFEKILKI